MSVHFFVIAGNISFESDLVDRGNASFEYNPSLSPSGAESAHKGCVFTGRNFS